jgi:hypothetical protein
MDEKLIFISCGQQTEEEKRLGGVVKELVDQTPGFSGYFAEYVQSLDGLASDIFEALGRCSGFVGFLHERGTVRKEGGGFIVRTSVWINQEIAILAYRRFREGTTIPILVFKDQQVQVEGAMTSLIVNAHPIEDAASVSDRIAKWLSSTEFPPPSGVSDADFQSLWTQLSDKAREVIRSLRALGGVNVKESILGGHLADRKGIPRQDAANWVRDARIEFQNTDLVKLVPNIHSGDEMSINPTWQSHIAGALSDQRRSASEAT